MPVSTLKPSPARTIRPTRSASGSEPRMKSAPSLLASSTARAKPSGFSGLGEATVEKLPSMTICSGTQITCFMPSRFSASGMSL